MDEIEVRKPTADELEELGVFSWPTWGCEVSTFPWRYEERETCYLLEGQVRILVKDECVAEFGAGDLVVLPKNLGCTWCVLEGVKKHFRFG